MHGDVKVKKNKQVKKNKLFSRKPIDTVTLTSYSFDYECRCW